MAFRRSDLQEAFFVPGTLPRLAHLHRDEEIRRRLTPLIARWVTLIGAGMALVLAVAMDLVVEDLFGPGYAQAATVLWRLLPGIVVFNCTRILGNDLAARGRPDLNAWTAALSLVVNITGNLLLIPLYCIIGAALATTLSYGTTTFATILLYTRLSGNRIRDVVHEPGRLAVDQRGATAGPGRPQRWSMAEAPVEPALDEHGAVNYIARTGPPATALHARLA